MPATFIGRRIGGWVASRWGRDLGAALEAGKGLSAPLTRALLDAFVLDSLTASIWPAVAAVVALLAAHAGAPLLPGGAEAERVLVGAVVLSALAWTCFGVASGARAAWPHLRFWAATRLRPAAHVRLVIFHLLRAQHRRLLAGGPEDGVAGRTAAAAFDALQKELRMTPDRAAYTIADHLAPVVLRHLAGRLALVALPVVGALAYYRFVVYPGLVWTDGGAGPWGMSLYPVAALCDVTFGTRFRAALVGLP